MRSAGELAPLHNVRPVMVQNDTHVFDLLVLAPVVHGWVLLGESGKYVRVSRDRIRHVAFRPTGLTVGLMGTEGESVELTALRPAASDWEVVVQRVTFPKGSGGEMDVAFK